MKMKMLPAVFLFICLATSAQWTRQESNTSFNLIDVYFLNDSVGFIVGNGGLFLKTNNRGLTWDQSVIRASDNLKAVFAINEDTLFAGGDSLYKSTDGGQTWIRIYNQLDIREINFFSPETGFIKIMYQFECYPSVFYDQMKYKQTNDGGNTWQNCQELPQSLDDGFMEVVSADTGFFFGDLLYYEYHCDAIMIPRMYKTTNGGTSWDELEMFSYYGQNKGASFVNVWEGYLLYAYNGLKLYQISNGGADINYVTGITGSSIGNLVFPNLYEGYYSQAGNIMKSTSGGFLWEEDYAGTQNLTDLFITENYEAYAIGNSGLILHQKLDPVTEPDGVYRIDCNTASLSFPWINIGEDTTLTFTLTASGNQDITADIIAPPDFLIKTADGDQFVQEITGLVIPASHDTVISVSFHSSEYKNYLDTIFITNNSTNQPLLQIVLSGKGVCFLPPVIQKDTIFCFDSVWVKNSVTIPQSMQITFCPGTVVTFQGGYRMDINGSLKAAGNVADSIRFIGLSPGTKWAGLTIAGENSSDSVIFDYCHFENSKCNNQPDNSGGAINITGTRNVEIRNSSIYGCVADTYGGGIFCTSPGCMIRDCDISSCSAKKGGGLYYKAGRAKAISGCVVRNCSVTDYGNGWGGGIYCEGDADSVIINCDISDCSADMGGGMFLCGSKYSVHNCEVSGCSALYSSGGIFAGESGASIIEGVKIQECTSQAGAGISVFSSAHLQILNCEISGCEADDAGGGIYISGADSVVVKNCAIYNNRVNGGYAAGIGLDYASPVIRDCRIFNNNAFMGYGSGIYSYGGSPKITGNVIYENIAYGDGAGIYLDAYESVDTIEIIQNLLYDNSTNSGKGAGLFLRRSTANIFQNTLTLNQAPSGPGEGIYCSQSGNLMIRGNIMYNNGNSEFFTEDESNTILEYNDIKGGWTGPGTGNIDLDPMFCNNTYHQSGNPAYDFSLKTGSPCIDNSVPDTANMHLTLKDLSGNPRLAGNRLDIGAYENNFLFQTVDTGFCEGKDLQIEAIPLEGDNYTSIFWTFNGEVIPVENTGRLLIVSPEDDDEGYYQCSFYGENGLMIRSRAIYLYNKGFAPEILVQPAGAVLNEGDDYTLECIAYSIDHYNFYQWYLNDTAIEGANYQQLDIADFSKEKQGIYKCRAENTCGAIFSDEALLLLNSAGIEEIDDQIITIHPNPVKNILTLSTLNSTLSTQNSVLRTQHSITITNLLGQTLMKFENISSFPYEADISPLVPGLYILRIEDEDGHSMSRRFIKAAD